MNFFLKFIYKSTDFITESKAAFHTEIDKDPAGRCQKPTADKPLPIKTVMLYNSTSSFMEEVVEVIFTSINMYNSGM